MGQSFFSTADYPNALEFDVDTNLSYEYIVLRLDERCPDILYESEILSRERCCGAFNTTTASADVRTDIKGHADKQPEY